VLLATVRPPDAAGKTRRRVAAELISDLERILLRKKAADKELSELPKTTGITLTDLNGLGPSGVARLLVEAGDIIRFPAGRTSRRGMAHQMTVDVRTARTDPGGHSGTTLQSSVTGLNRRPALRISHFPGPPANSLKPRPCPRLDTEGSHERVSARRCGENGRAASRALAWALARSARRVASENLDAGVMAG
jgi:hypothetical protein